MKINLGNIKVSEIWKNKSSILEGIKNNMFKKEHVEEIYNERLEICKNCKYYDPEGKSPKAVTPGDPACGACGCPLATKLRSLSTVCGKASIGETPLWTSITDQETEDKLKEKL